MIDNEKFESSELRSIYKRIDWGRKHLDAKAIDILKNVKTYDDGHRMFAIITDTWSIVAGAFPTYKKAIIAKEKLEEENGIDRTYSCGHFYHIIECFHTMESD